MAQKLRHPGLTAHIFETAWGGVKLTAMPCFWQETDELILSKPAVYQGQPEVHCRATSDSDITGQ